ncbi:MAG: hypothetical protein ACXWCB_16050 [Acidimicrobiales bacterium]
MPRRSRRTGSLLAVAWVAGTVAAVVISIAAINLAGSKVTARPISTVSKSGIEQALAGDATVLVRDSGSETASDALTTDDHGGSGSVSDDSSGPGSGDRSVSGGSSSGSGSGDDGGSGGGSGSGDGGSGDGGDSGGSGGGGSGDSGSTTTTEHEHEQTPTTTAAPSSPVSRTVSGNTVTVRCTGDTIALVSATAASGFSKEIDKSGPQEVSVQFVNQQTDAEVEIQARCSHGSASWD